MRNEEYVTEHPEVCVPGNTDLLFPKSSIPVLSRLQAQPKPRRYRARCYLSSAYDTALTRAQTLRCRPATRVRLTGSQRGWQIRANKRPICLRAEVDRRGFLRSVHGWTRGELPSEALHLFKSAVALLLDRLVVLLQVPIYVQRTELYLDSKGHKLIEVTFPPDEAGVGGGGGLDLPMFFHSYWSLEREAICAPSPIYRFMCRWRAFESIARMRTAIRKFAERVQCKGRMPEIPRLTHGDRKALRLTHEVHARARTLEDVVRCYGELRDAVAHFWSGEEKHASKGTVVPYRSLDVLACEKASQVIRICNQRLVDPLWSFFTRHLSSAYSRGSILALEGQERDFCACDESLPIYR